ncbi:beta-amyrin 28-monooxygenase-like isoform X2 [Punica granatum]|uniref:Beta-amyrin 28-monooxygenase-like isoform X2 n=1 Tax=Punica granatum TaxID=22663 RepID=A0A6P8CLA0_PUNGR|nr:beta-amyrin 28-monooxygenase-like isoform X2 [Punica granatum]
MDLFETCTLYIAILYVSLSLTIYLVRRHKSGADGTALNLPPGRIGWPIIGETLDFVMAGRNGTPEKFVTDRTSRYSSDIFRTSLLGMGDVAVFCGASGNKFLFSGENKYVTSWWPRSINMVLEFPDPEAVDMDNFYNSDAVAKSRSFNLEFVKPEALQRYIPIMDSMAKQHLEADWAPYGEVRAFPLLKKYTFALSCRLIMSIHDPAHLARIEHNFALVTAGLLSVPINFPGTAFNKAVQAGKSMREDLLSIINCRKKEIVDEKDIVVKDLLSRMLLAKDESGQPIMKDTEIGNTIIANLIGSHGTISTTITFVMNYLAEYPDVYKQVLKEQTEIARSKGPDELLNWDDVQKMRYSWMVACEVMRLCPAGPGGYRETHWTPYSTHKDPQYFPDPEKFDPSRFKGSGPVPYTFVPFGGGPRMCPGKEYARVLVLVVMHNLVTNFRWKKTIPDEKIIYNPFPVLVSGLPIRTEPHA